MILYQYITLLYAANLSDDQANSCNIMMIEHPQTEAYPILERLVQTQLYWNRCGARIISIVYSSKEKVT